MDQIDETLTRGVENIIPGKVQLEKLLRSGKKLSIYLGIDPTATRIHLGNAVAIRKLQSFVSLGHHVHFLIGDFTALVGDTSDKESERPILSSGQIQENFQDYKKQAEKLLDFSKVKIVHNGDWLAKMGPEDFIRLFQQFSLNDFIGRELIKKRLAAGGSIRLDETVYPLLQGFDSYHLNTDIQIGGADQTFNMQAGRKLQKEFRSKESFVLVTGYLEGTDGRKMSKSWGNAIWLDDTPDEIFGKVMSVNDDLIITYFTLATSLPIEQINQISQELSSGKNPMLAKKTLAHRIVKELHSESEADKAERQFELAFQTKDLKNSDMPEIKTPKTAINPEDLVAEFGYLTKTEAKRLLHQNAVELNGQLVEKGSAIKIQSGDILKIGKKKFLKFV